MSDWQLMELQQVLSRPKIRDKYQISPERLSGFFKGFNDSEKVVPIAVVPVPIRDPKDVQIMAAALGGNAEYLVTGDNDLLVLRDDSRLGGLRIVTVTEFLTLLVL